VFFEDFQNFLNRNIGEKFYNIEIAWYVQSLDFYGFQQLWEMLYTFYPGFSVTN
jgi:hypothetical protein